MLDNQGGWVAGWLVIVGMATRGRRVDVLSPGTPGQHGASYDAGRWRSRSPLFTFARRYVGRRLQVRPQLPRRSSSGVDPASGTGPWS